jgi:hypothetical protein
MKLLGLLLLLSGWAIVRTALELLHGNALPVFVLAGLVTEVLGLGLLARAHISREDTR